MPPVCHGFEPKQMVNAILNKGFYGKIGLKRGNFSPIFLFCQQVQSLTPPANAVFALNQHFFSLYFDFTMTFKPPIPLIGRF